MSFFGDIGGILRTGAESLAASAGPITAALLAQRSGSSGGGPPGGGFPGFGAPQIVAGSRPVAFPDFLPDIFRGDTPVLPRPDLPFLPDVFGSCENVFTRPVNGARSGMVMRPIVHTTNPNTGALEFYARRGRPLVFSGDMRLVKNINKIGRRLNPTPRKKSRRRK